MKLTRRRWNGIVFVFAFSIVRRGTATPYTLLVNKAPKCWNVEAPNDTPLTVQYAAPGKTCVDAQDIGMDVPLTSLALCTIVTVRYDHCGRKSGFL
jgi:hypothetical protein